MLDPGLRYPDKEDPKIGKIGPFQHIQHHCQPDHPFHRHPRRYHHEDAGVLILIYNISDNLLYLYYPIINFNLVNYHQLNI